MWGRYTQSDPLGHRGEPNPYGYARQNPLSFVDLFGLKAGAYTCCKSNALTVCVVAPVPDEPMLGCMVAHERKHLDQVRKLFPCNACVGKKDEAPAPDITDFQEAGLSDLIPQLECDAYKVEYKCLESKLPTASNPAAVQQRMADIMRFATQTYGCSGFGL